MLDSRAFHKAETSIVRRVIISSLLPTLFCLVPFALAALVAVAIPTDAMTFFLAHVSPMDSFILGLGSVLFTAQIIFCWRALRWYETGFDAGLDRWVNHLAQSAEWFPMLGLIGTVGGILQTFASITGPIQPHQIIERYSPAITATGSGLYMAFINILPSWMVIFGRDVILSLGDRRANSEGGAT